MAATFTILNPGRIIRLKPLFQRGKSWTRGRIVHRITPIERAIVDGGYYGVKPIGGSEFVQDLIIDLHRSAFVPESNTPLARAARKKQR